MILAVVNLTSSDSSALAIYLVSALVISLFSANADIPLGRAEDLISTFPLSLETILSFETFHKIVLRTFTLPD